MSESICEGFASLGVEAGRIHLLPSGLEGDDHPSRSKDRALESFERAGGVKLLYIGSLVPRKSVGTLISAHRELVRAGVPVCTAIVGSGPDEQNLRRQAADSSGLVFAPLQPPGQVAAWMRATDAVVLPSLSEGRPNVVSEAMALGRAVLASDIPGVGELVLDGQTGFLFASGDAGGLAEAVKKLVALDAVSREEMSLRARERALTVTPSVVEIARRHLDIYARITTS